LAEYYSNNSMQEEAIDECFEVKINIIWLKKKKKIYIFSYKINFKFNLIFIFFLYLDY
jgi:hypothetical protein